MTRRLHRLFSRVRAAALAVLCLSSGLSMAQESFATPERYPQDRYETGWMKNPFTLKTAPVVVEKKSFAKDLVLHNIVRVGNDVTAVLANAKTKEMYRVKNNEPASNGMKIRHYEIKDARKDSFVEVELHGEIAVVRPDDAFRKQMLAGNSARGNRGKAGMGPGAAGPDGDANAKDATGQPLVTPNGAPGMSGAGAGASPSTTLRPPVERPPLPQRTGPGPTPPPMPGSTEPANIRPGSPGPGTMPQVPRGAPSRSGRRFFTAPISIPPPAAAPASDAQ